MIDRNVGEKMRNIIIERRKSDIEEREKRRE